MKLFGCLFYRRSERVLVCNLPMVELGDRACLQGSELLCQSISFPSEALLAISLNAYVTLAI